MQGPGSGRREQASRECAKHASARESVRAGVAGRKFPSRPFAAPGCRGAAVQAPESEKACIPAGLRGFSLFHPPEVVAGEGIEPPTRGFSIPCSTN